MLKPVNKEEAKQEIIKRLQNSSGPLSFSSLETIRLTDDAGVPIPGWQKIRTDTTRSVLKDMEEDGVIIVDRRSHQGRSWATLVPGDQADNAFVSLANAALADKNPEAPISKTEERILILSFLRRYGSIKGDRFVISETPSEPMLDVDALFQLLSDEHGIGVISARKVFLGQPTDRESQVNKTFNDFIQDYLPWQLRSSLTHIKQLRQRIHNHYPLAYAEYEKWIANPDDYAPPHKSLRETRILLETAEAIILAKLGADNPVAREILGEMKTKAIKGSVRE